MSAVGKFVAWWVAVSFAFGAVYATVNWQRRRPR